MIIVEVGRGLGNSMYVYAAGLSLAKKRKTKLKIDTSFLDSWPRPKYKFGGSWDPVIEKFNITAKRASKREVLKFIVRTGFRPIDRFLYKRRLFERNVVRFPTHGDPEKFFKISDNTYLFGYFGHEKFFKWIKKDILKEFSLKEEYKRNISEQLSKISSENSVSIHIRRGDVLDFKDPNFLGRDYCQKCVNLIKKKVKNPIFYIFSDEIEWCKENLKGIDKDLHFVEGNKDYEDLELMKNCKHNILANSALSWWAGYLNENRKKIVIAPNNFSHYKDSSDSSLPDGWIKL